MRRLALLLALVVLAAKGVAEASSFSSSNIDFLGRGRSCGLVAAPGAIDNVFWNPSGLGAGEWTHPAVFAGFMDYLVGTRGVAVGFVSRQNTRWGYGPYLTYLGLGSIPVTTWDNPLGGRDGDFSFSEIAAGIGAGAEALPYLWLGGGLKFVRSSLVNDAITAACLDLSGTARIFGGSTAGATSGFVCAVARDIGLMTWDDTGEAGDPPTNVEVGAAVRTLDGKALLGCSFLEERGGGRDVRFGVSGLLSEEFEARLGYRRRLGTGSDSSIDSGWQRGLVAGFSVSLGKFWVDYTYEDASPLDSIHRLAVRVD